ncbi:MAG: phosphatidate cytidylyltransferase [Methylophagaceae bacterium]|jgi:phosphatidate cytidylyltransferase
MLKQRLWTAGLLIPVVMLSILFLPASILQWLIAAIIILAAIEWFAIIGYAGRKQMISAILVLAIIIGLVWLLPKAILLFMPLVVWGLILLMVSRYAHRAMPACIQACLMKRFNALILASLVLALFGHGAVILHHSSLLGPQQLLFVIVLIWLADTGGYFAGKRWGKTPLAKAISPNKTWEGVAGAVVLGAIWTLIGYKIGISGMLSLTQWLLLSLSALLISIVGDLFESLFKRCHKIKDSGNLLPGHGGMLDRIDSLIAGVPVFTAGLFLLGAF